MPSQNDFGCLRFWAVSTYNEINNSKRAFLADLLDDPPAPKTTDWHKITECIHLGSAFTLTAVSPTFTVSLRFNPESENDGWYRITFQNHRTPEETGRIGKIVIVKEQASLVGPSRQAIARFPYKFEMETIGDDRGHTRKVWAVGISHFHTPNETSDAKPWTV